MCRTFPGRPNGQLAFGYGETAGSGIQVEEQFKLEYLSDDFSRSRLEAIDPDRQELMAPGRIVRQRRKPEEAWSGKHAAHKVSRPSRDTADYGLCV
jgi:hypothetical protein